VGIIVQDEIARPDKKVWWHFCQFNSNVAIDN
jgi:hypothetical protein